MLKDGTLEYDWTTQETKSHTLKLTKNPNEHQETPLWLTNCSMIWMSSLTLWYPQKDLGYPMLNIRKMNQSQALLDPGLAKNPLTGAEDIQHLSLNPWFDAVLNL